MIRETESWGTFQIPAEEALMAFVGIEIPKMEMNKGIPFVSFVAKKGEGAVFTSPLPLPAAEDIFTEQMAGREVLYRVDYLRSGRETFAAGVLTAGEEPESFLKTLGRNISTGSKKADAAGIYAYLETHLTLCRLERLALREVSFLEKPGDETGGNREADISYYKEILAYVEAGRRSLNSGGKGTSFPAFPLRNEFMAGWHRERKDRKQKNIRETGQKMEGV
ncbi:MAG: hypothetical protein NC389_10705 [Acetatifactor muris]|nr:hypothetical protein [Acetatifactor muris]